MYDVIIVGAGLSGAVMAERFASQSNKRVLVLEKRAHIAGNCYDYVDPTTQILVHQYGPHLFHTDNEEVFRYLSEFTDWVDYHHKVTASLSLDGRDVCVPLPFNFSSIRACFAKSQAELLINKLRKRFGDGARVSILALRQEQDQDLMTLADFVYEQVFINYTTKQWGKTPEQIDPAVTARVPIVCSEEDGYFSDPHQCVPKQGYTAMVANMLASPLIDVQLNTDFRERVNIDLDNKSITLDGKPFLGEVIYSANLDLLTMGHEALPYRSLRFEFETLAQKTFQQGTTVNYPQHPSMTRITEFKHIPNSQSVSDQTIIVKEYPIDYDPNNPAASVPYYPLFDENSQSLFQQLRAHAEQVPNLTLVGRLAQYQYFDMDDAVANALTLFDRWKL